MGDAGFLVSLTSVFAGFVLSDEHVKIKIHNVIEAKEGGRIISAT